MRKRLAVIARFRAPGLGVALVRRLGLGLPAAGELALALAERGHALRGVPLTMDELLEALGDAP